MKLRIDIDNHYLTWKTAHEDVDNQRRAGFVGEKFEIQTKLVNKNHGKFRIIDGEKNFLKSKWEYYILSIKRLN